MKRKRGHRASLLKTPDPSPFRAKNHAGGTSAEGRGHHLDVFVGQGGLLVVVLFGNGHFLDIPGSRFLEELDPLGLDLVVGHEHGGVVVDALGCTPVFFLGRIILPKGRIRDRHFKKG